MVQYQTPTTPIPSGSFCLRIVIPNDTPWRSALFGALDTLTSPSSWVQAGLLSPDDTVQYLQKPVLEAMEGGDWCMIGAIWPYASADPPPHTLPCEGQSLAAADYPKLFAALDPAFIDGEDTFHLPNISYAFVIGANIGDTGDYPVGGTGGEATHTLTVDEIPAHSHTDLGHSHTEGAAVPTIINGGLEAPAPAATPSPSVTGSGNANIQNTGGGNPHNNIPPYVALRWCIVYE